MFRDRGSEVVVQACCAFPAPVLAVPVRVRSGGARLLAPQAKRDCNGFAPRGAAIRRSNMVHYSLMDSPVGPLLLCATARGLCGVYMQTDRHARNGVAADWVADPARLAPARTQLGEYFAGTRRSFDLPLDLAGTPFQQSVWQALCAIPYGQTISYGELARRIGKPAAVRAVGLANGRNPVSIIVPCHRVIGADGSLTGYGGGLPNKRILLALEGAWPATAEGSGVRMAAGQGGQLDLLAA